MVPFKNLAPCENLAPLAPLRIQPPDSKPLLPQLLAPKAIFSAPLLFAWGGKNISQHIFKKTFSLMHLNFSSLQYHLDELSHLTDKSKTKFSVTGKNKKLS